MSKQYRYVGMFSGFKVYVVSYDTNRCGVRKLLVLDSRKRVVRKLPDPKVDSLNDIVRVCREIKGLRDSGYSWIAISELYGRSIATVKRWFRKWCEGYE
jgi:hypothetical protein